MDFEKEKEELKIKDQREYYISKRNDFIRRAESIRKDDILREAKFLLGVNEQKMMAFIFSKIKPDDTELQIYSFTVDEYCKVFGIDYGNGGNYKYIRKIIDKLCDTAFWLINDNGEETKARWIDKPWMSQKSGLIRVRLDEDIQQYIIGLKDQKYYTQYQLLYTLGFQSKYSFRLYELLRSYHNPTKTNRTFKSFDIDEIKKILNAEKYSNYKDFRKIVLEKAVNEINAYTDIYIEKCEAIKKGRKVIRIDFVIKNPTRKQLSESERNRNEKLNKTIA